jgi:nucleoside-diphosphate-sugar epimerase
MKALITGHHGFIGRHLAGHLRDRGDDVIGMDRHAIAQYNRRDLRESIRGVLEAERPDLVIHLAAQVGRVFGEDDVTATVADNAQATTVLARDCGELGIRMVYASTSEVYGDRGEQTCTESMSLDVLPHNLYGLSKRWGEEACRLYTNDPVLLRFSMPYGPGAPPGRGRRALDTMLWQAYHGMPITVHAGAERSWCWIGDLMDGIRRVIDSGEGGAWNIGRDDDPVTMLDLAQRCCALTGRDPDELIEVVSAPAQQTVVKRLGTDKLRALGWKPTVDLDEGLERMLDWVSRFDRDGTPRTERQAA